MGISIFSDTYKTDSGIKTPNPNPRLFRIINRERIGDYTIVEARYYGCTTFDGCKLMLLKSNKVPYPLDPHLLGGNHPVIARFEPNENGWKLARLCALELMN